MFPLTGWLSEVFCHSKAKLTNAENQNIKVGLFLAEAFETGLWEEFGKVQ
jgi:hypothetical protein